MTEDQDKPISEDNRSYHHGDLPNALMAAALDILVEEGVEALSLRAVARRAGVSQAAPYYHFKDKQSLLAAVAAEGHHKLAELCNEFYDPDLPGYEGLLSMGVGYLTFAKEHPDLFRLMFSPEIGLHRKGTGHQALLEALAASNAVIDGAVTKAFAPALTEDSTKFIHAKAAAFSIVHGMATLIVNGHLEFPPVRTQEFNDFAIQTFSVFDDAVFARAT